MAESWREYIFLPPDQFAVLEPAQPGIPRRARVTAVNLLDANLCDAYLYWNIREGWRTLGVDAFGALYAKWQPKRDAILGKEEHLSKSRAEWSRFFLALADERAAREFAVGKAKAAFGSEFVDAYLGESGRVGRMMQGGRAG